MEQGRGGSKGEESWERMECKEISRERKGVEKRHMRGQERRKGEEGVRGEERVRREEGE